MKWTEAQSQTINIRNKNILVSAAAGSGKTAVLIERIKQLILKDKVDIDRFLITTFTNPAAAEMKERLEKAIRAELTEPGADKAFLKRQLNLLPKAGISTFHAFALEVMRRYFYLTDLEPGFKIGDDIQVSIMKNEAVDQLFEDRFNEDYDNFTEFLKKYSSDRSENKIKSNLMELYTELRSVPAYMEWAEKSTELLNTESPMAAIGIMDFITEEAASELDRAAGLYEKAVQILDEAGIDSLVFKAEQDAEKVQQIAALAAEIKNTKAGAGETGSSSGSTAVGTDITEKSALLRELLQNPGFNSMRASKAQQEDYNEVKETVAACRKNGKKIIDDLFKKYFKLSLAEYDEELKESYVDTKYMVGLIADFEIIFKQKKSERNIVDFDDAMHYAIEILKDPMVAAEYRETFRYIFVDEFQDSNMLQENIVGRITGEDNLFMVGDVKQSIYKFRLAEPEIFKRKYALYKQDSEINSTKIDLNNNFRSKLNVTKTVNAVFAEVMDDYDEDARLHCTVDENYPGYASSLHIICKAKPEAADKSSGATEQEEELFDNSEQEAALAAQLIEENLGKPIYDVKKAEMRPIEYKDIVILSRNKATIAIIEKYLNNEGIPAYGENTGGYFETVEVQVFINLLKVIDNTRQDIPLISVMRSVIFDFDVKELAAVRIAFRDGSFYQAVKAYEEQGRDERLKGKIREMMEQITYWKEIKKTVELEELVRMLLYDTGYFDYCSGLPAGKQRTSNLRMLVEKASDFEQNDFSGLYGFLSYVEAMKKGDLSMGEAKVLGEGENVVRVMTVHKSKGLEFPVVILTGAGRDIKFKGIGNSVVMHKDFAIGLPHVNREEHWHRKTILQRAIAGKKRREDLEEEIRILYVALTRAMDRLLITACIKDAAKLDEDESNNKSFLGMVYAPMKAAAEEIKIHSGQMRTFEEKRQESGRQHVLELFEEAARNRDEEKLEKIDQRLSFVYPYADMGKVKLKYTVTELNKREDVHSSENGGGQFAGKAVLSRPLFDTEKRQLNAAEIGTAMHLVMEKLDFSEALAQGRKYIEEVITGLLDDAFLSAEEKEAVNVDNIVAFFTQDIAGRASAAESAGKLYKEREFIMQKEISGVPAIVQGIIDCYFEEDGELVLIDYKNSYLSAGVSEAEIRERYEQQIRLYEEALEASIGMRVKESYLYLFNSKEPIQRV